MLRNIYRRLALLYSNLMRRLSSIPIIGGFFLSLWLSTAAGEQALQRLITQTLADYAAAVRRLNALLEHEDDKDKDEKSADDNAASTTDKDKNGYN